jgi:hypothetical protein
MLGAKPTPRVDGAYGSGKMDWLSTLQKTEAYGW